jgi:hypothetical protein
MQAIPFKVWLRPVKSVDRVGGVVQPGGVLGHEGSTVIVVFNGLRLLWEKTPKLT